LHATLRLDPVDIGTYRLAVLLSRSLIQAKPPGYARGGKCLGVKRAWQSGVRRHGRRHLCLLIWVLWMKEAWRTET
jgi:hypothetical protein